MRSGTLQNDAPVEGALIEGRGEVGRAARHIHHARLQGRYDID
jgi:hypothetical protein